MACEYSVGHHPDLLVCLIALIGMLLGSMVLKDPWIGLILAFSGYIVARLIFLVRYGE